LLSDAATDAGNLADCESAIVRKAALTVSAVLGPANPASTKKVWRWERCGIYVNIHREGRHAATIWIAGGGIESTGRVTLGLQPELGSGIPPKNSNCSLPIRTGPTWFTYVTDDHELGALSRLLANLIKGEVTLSDYETSAELEDEGGAEEAPLELEIGERRLATQSLDLSIEALVARISRHGLILQPEFQRDYVWSAGKASALVESILMRIPLPVVYLAETAESDWEVVDGQQRLTSLYSYVVGQFPDNTAFRLGQMNVRNDLKGKAFKDLSKTDQNAILNYTLRAVILQKESHPDLKFEVFERLNCGSVALKDAELRNCMYRGPYNDMLNELAENPFLVKIRHADTPHKRMDDRQLILRFFAMKRNTHLNYRGGMKQFMNREMFAHRNALPSEIAAMKAMFESAIECAWTVFGPNAFRRWSPGNERSPDGQWETKLNVALWDTVLYTFAFFEKRQIVPAADAIREEFLDLMSSDDIFVDYIGRTTDKPDRVRYRADTWRRRLEAAVVVPAGETRSFSRKLKEDLHTADPACAICGQHIHSPEDAEVDHIKHYWRGGATIPQNARLAHRHCNRRRGGR
jgi:5-methylcytosine-specific restriction endonuclease McrA